MPDGVGVALADAEGDGVGDGVGVSEGESLADGDALAGGDALALGVGVGLVADADVQPVSTSTMEPIAPSMPK